jgi:hypothetical protein
VFCNIPCHDPRWFVQAWATLRDLTGMHDLKRTIVEEVAKPHRDMQIPLAISL